MMFRHIAFTFFIVQVSPFDAYFEHFEHVYYSMFSIQNQSYQQKLCFGGQKDYKNKYQKITLQ